MAGLIGVGRNTLDQATGGFRGAATLETQRNNAADQLKAARDAQRMSSVSTGAGLGASAGVQAIAKAGGIGGKLAPMAGQTITVGGAGAGAGLGTAATTATTAAGTAAGTAASTLPASVAAVGDLTATIAPAVIEVPGIAGATSGIGGMGAAIGAVATPLLIGAGAALLLDSLFDIF